MLEFDGKDGDKEKYIAIAALFAFALKVVAFPIEALKDSWQCAVVEVLLETERFRPLQELRKSLCCLILNIYNTLSWS